LEQNLKIAILPILFKKIASKDCHKKHSVHGYVGGNKIGLENFDGPLASWGKLVT
jgi:hypothetical protein